MMNTHNMQAGSNPQQLPRPSSTFSAQMPPPSSSYSSFSALSVIRKRKRGVAHTREELEWFVNAFTNHRIPDYQMAAWLMAANFQPLTPNEIAFLTRCMVQSGSTLQWDTPTTGQSSANPAVGDGGGDVVILRVDKHSSGGVGDKTSLVLAPLVAAASENRSSSSSSSLSTPRLHVPMMAGRGLGHTGGTIDKLESIPGFDASLSIEAFQNVVTAVGCAITSPTLEICPADRALYALRDATATVASIGLQTASILSKKLAEHPDFLVLDVKYGQGAFQATMEEAQELAHSLVTTAHANGLPTVALLTRMDHPLGRAVGNWVEVVECVDLMTPPTHASLSHRRRSRLSRDLLVVTLVAALELLQFDGSTGPRDANVDANVNANLDCLIQALQSGAVRTKFDEMVQAQGGDLHVLETDESRFGPPMHRLTAPVSGVLTNVHAQLVGLAAVAMGAGRQQADDAVDPGAGLVWHQQVGDVVEAGEVVADVYTHIQPEAWLEQLQDSIEYASSDTVPPPKTPRPVVTHKVTIDGVQPYVTPPRLIDFANSWCNA